MEPALIAAVSALIAALISATVFLTNAGMQRRHEYRLRVADKYEEMAWLVHEAEAWLIEIEAVIGAAPSLEDRYPKPAAKAQVIAGLYFKSNFYMLLKTLTDQLNDYRSYLADFQSMARPGETVRVAAMRHDPIKCSELRQQLTTVMVSIHLSIRKKVPQYKSA